MNIDDTDVKFFLNATANETSDLEARSTELANRVASATDAVISHDSTSCEGLRYVSSDQSPCITISSTDNEDDTPVKEKSSSIPSRDSDGGDCGIVRYVTSPTLKPNTLVACARGSSAGDSRQTSVKEVDQAGREISRQSSSSTTSGNVFSADSRQTSVKEIDRSSGEVTPNPASRQASTATASTDVQSLSALEAEARRGGSNDRDAEDSVRYVSSPRGGEERLPSVMESFDTTDTSQLDITDSAFECWRMVNALTQPSDYEQINLIPKCSSREGVPLPPTPDDDNHVYAGTAKFAISISIYHRCLKRLACEQLGRVLLASVITAVALMLCSLLLFVFVRPSPELSLQMSAVHRRSILVKELESAYRGVGIVSVSQDGKLLLVGESQTSTLLICDVNSTSPIAPTAACNCTPVPLPDSTTIWDAAWTPQGDIALAAYDNGSIIIIRPSGSVVDIWPASGPLHFTLSTDNVMYAADYYEGIFELTASGLEWRIVHPPPSGAIGFYDVVKVQHASATGDNGEETTARFWVLEDNTDTNRERLCYFSADTTVRGRYGACQSAAMPSDVQIYLNVSKLAYDGRDGVLVVDSRQEAVHVWSATTGQYRGQLLSYVNRPQRVTVDPTRRLLYVGRKSGLVDVYELLYNET